MTSLRLRGAIRALALLGASCGVGCGAGECSPKESTWWRAEAASGSVRYALDGAAASTIAIGQGCVATFDAPLTASLPIESTLFVTCRGELTFSAIFGVDVRAVPADGRAHALGPATASLTRTSSSSSPACWDGTASIEGSVTVTAATGGAAPLPGTVSSEYARTFDFALRLVAPTANGTASACSVPGTLQATFTLADAPANYHFSRDVSWCG